MRASTSCSSRSIWYRVIPAQDRRGAPGKVTGEQWEQARAWRAQGASDAEIGRRLEVAHTTIGRGLGPREQAPARERGHRPGACLSPVYWPCAGA